MAAPTVSKASWRHDEVMQRKEGRSHAAERGAGSTQVSALPPIADIGLRVRNVRLVPKADIDGLSRHREIEVLQCGPALRVCGAGFSVLE